MFEEIVEHHESDEAGNPAGGCTQAVGITIIWQNGPLVVGDIKRSQPTTGVPRRESPNGAFVEGVIAAAIGRLKFYQDSKFNCRENALAITHLEEALHWCNHRTADREKRGVEGTHKV